MSRTCALGLAVAIGICAFWSGGVTAGEDAKRLAVVCPHGASPQERLAAREIVRYVYLRTGKLLPVVVAGELRDSDGGFAVARKDRPIVDVLASDADLKTAVAALAPQQYLLRTVQSGWKTFVLVVGGDDAGVLYGTYRLAEKLGVRFYMHGDVVPDEPIALALPSVNEIGKPLFNLRGIQPFHDFPEGPDWWSTDDFKAVISQLPKLRMNFIGLHTYPEGGVGPEPTVWIGRSKDLAADGKTLFNYSSSWMNTLRGNWGYQPIKTGDYAFGASQLFEEDGFGDEAMIGQCPRPTTPEGFAAVFDRSGRLLREAFAHARLLGVKTCVGTETPLIVPALVRQRLGAGKDQVRELYEGMFLRIMGTYPVDYYWLWTPEGWTWSGASDADVQATITDIQTALAALKKVGAPFTLATCGWVLGPPKDRAMFDQILPKNVPFSCINREVGKSPVETGFAKVQGRPKWAIPWMEDDPNLLCTQLWAGRMRKDAVDSLRYGCTGLMGIHWRTQVLGPNVSALAAAAWDQSWAQSASASAPAPAKKQGPEGGMHAAFPNNPIADTPDVPLYQSVRYDVSAYRFQVPDGTYTVTLKFCEPFYKEAGKRVFGVQVQGKQVIDKLDLFAKVGQNKALDCTFKDVAVKGGWLDIDFTKEVEFPSIAAIVIEGPATRKVNCGGGAYKDYAADWPDSGPASGADRFLPTDDFYLDWATAQFGPEVAQAAGKIFARIDCRLPQTSTWTDGPGGIQPNGAPIDKVLDQFAFVSELEALLPKVKGAGNIERFNYWLSNFRFMMSVEKVKCLWARFNAAMKEVNAQKGAAAQAELAQAKALPIRRELVAACAEASGHLMKTVGTYGELGTVMNWQERAVAHALIGPGKELAKALGKDLPADAQPSGDYAGAARLIVPTLRTSVVAGEELTLKVIVLSAQAPQKAALYWRPMGGEAFAEVPLSHVARGVYKVKLPAQAATVVGVEYYVKAAFDGGGELSFPATAPRLNQTVVVEQQ